MKLQEFSFLLKAKYPDAECCRNREFGGTPVNNGLAIAFKPDGKVYHYRGSFDSIAVQLKLVSVFSVRRGGEIIGEAFTHEEAETILVREQARYAEMAARWPYSWNHGRDTFDIVQTQ